MARQTRSQNASGASRQGGISAPPARPKSVRRRFEKPGVFGGVLGTASFDFAQDKEAVPFQVRRIARF